MALHSGGAGRKGEVMDTTHLGIIWAEEAIRDVLREGATSRAEAARRILAEGTDTWGTGELGDDDRRDALDAADSQLRDVAAKGK